VQDPSLAGLLALLPRDPLLAGVGALLLLGLLNLALLLRRPRAQERLLLLAEQAAAQHRAEAEITRGQLLASERALAGSLALLSRSMMRDSGAARALLETKLREMSEQAAHRLGAIQTAVNETLAASVEKQMTSSFQRVIDQFGQVQRAMTDVQAVTAQIGDLKRIFSNVKQRGTWGETHLRALLEDMFPQGGWEANRKLREGSDEAVEFAVVMPMRGSHRPLLALDAKFPTEDYDRLLLATEAGDLDGERAARRGLETRLRLEARKIGEKYVMPPVTVDFAVMYLPTDGLYVEAARIPGLIEALNREHRVLVMGPSLAPALLRTILLGTLTLSIEQRAVEIQNLLAAVRAEMLRMDASLGKLAVNAERMTKSVEAVRQRTRAMDRKLRGVTALGAAEADAVLEIDPSDDDEEAGAPASSSIAAGT